MIPQSPCYTPFRSFRFANAISSLIYISFVCRVSLHPLFLIFHLPFLWSFFPKHPFSKANFFLVLRLPKYKSVGLV